MITQKLRAVRGVRRPEILLNIDGKALTNFVRTVDFMVKPNEQLVTVSSTHYWAYTSVLSNR